MKFIKTVRNLDSPYLSTIKEKFQNYFVETIFSKSDLLESFESRNYLDLVSYLPLQKYFRVLNVADLIKKGKLNGVSGVNVYILSSSEQNLINKILENDLNFFEEKNKTLEQLLKEAGIKIGDCPDRLDFKILLLLSYFSFLHNRFDVFEFLTNCLTNYSYSDIGLKNNETTEYLELKRILLGLSNANHLHLNLKIYLLKCIKNGSKDIEYQKQIYFDNYFGSLNNKLSNYTFTSNNINVPFSEVIDAIINSDNDIIIIYAHGDFKSIELDNIAISKNDFYDIINKLSLKKCILFHSCIGLKGIENSQFQYSIGSEDKGMSESSFALTYYFLMACLNSPDYIVNFKNAKYFACFFSHFSQYYDIHTSFKTA